MRDTGCPPFLEVLSCLFSIILSFAMMGYLLLWLSAWGKEAVLLNMMVFFIAFGVMIVYCLFRLVRGLFPARFKRCRVCSLVREIIEIDEVVK